MKKMFIAIACIALSACALAQSADEPASRDDVILLLRTMHSHDMFERTMEVQSQSMQKLFRDQIVKDKGSIPPQFADYMKKVMGELMKNMPIDEVTQAMIPAYQHHFTRGDIEVLNAFYSSPVGQKFLEESPAVMQEGMQAAMPILSNYLTQWKQRMSEEVKQMEKDSPAAAPASKN